MVLMFEYRGCKMLQLGLPQQQVVYLSNGNEVWQPKQPKLYPWQNAVHLRV
jgi:hypothetical protein